MIFSCRQFFQWMEIFDSQDKNSLFTFCSQLSNRWVSVVEFHDRALIIGKVFGQESTVVKWNYQILGLHPVAVRQKLGVILVIKWFKNWSQQKMLFTKKVRLNWYSSMIFFRKIRMIFDIENSLWKSNFCTLRRGPKARQSILRRL